MRFLVLSLCLVLFGGFSKTDARLNLGLDKVLSKGGDLLDVITNTLNDKIDAISDIGTSIVEEKFIFPGTKWCGTGDIAKNYEDLGMFDQTDKCCRTHDHCDKIVETKKTNFGLYNDGTYTRSHCSCDEEFFKCLKAVKNVVQTVVAQKVGIKYFNLLAPQCFREEYPAKCVKRSRYLHKNRCAAYEYDNKGEKGFQWFDNPEF